LKITKNENLYVGFTKKLKLRFDQPRKVFVETKNSKAYYSPIFKKLLKSFLTG